MTCGDWESLPAARALDASTLEAACARFLGWRGGGRSKNSIRSDAPTDSAPHTPTPSLPPTLAAASSAPVGESAPAQPSSSSASTPPITPWWENHDPLPNVLSVHSLDDLLTALATAGDRLVVVDFFASWCRACRGVFPKVIAAAAARPDILFVKCEFEENKAVARVMGVKALPTFQFFRGPDGRLESLTAGPSKAAVLTAAIERHSAPRCLLGGDDTPAVGAPELVTYKASLGG